jgi:hypothetical protein
MLLVAAPFENLFENKARLPAGLGAFQTRTRFGQRNCFIGTVASKLVFAMAILIFEEKS